ncbi:MAG: ribulokinase [Actinobacteria bacterium]|nr:ribulokinase [Actinomycetota bacterium]
MADEKYIIGLDFGTDTVRALLVNAENGREVATAVQAYKRWNKSKYIDAAKNMFRHHPLDYLESMQEAVNSCLNQVSEVVTKNIVGIGVDTTGSTPAPVDIKGNVLALKDKFKDNPNAMFVLWKDHTATEEAGLINETAKNWGGVNYTKFSGGIYSSEWFFSKILHIFRIDKDVREAAYSWVELADWIPAVLTGNTLPKDIKRSRCAAGHKAMWNSQWDGLPPDEFLTAVDPLLSGLRDRLYTQTFTSDIKAGNLSKEWAKKFGLHQDIAVAIGAFDAHMGAVGANVRPGVFVKITGTSCCDMAVGPKQKEDVLIGGICGQVDGSIIPDMIGYEAGQSSFGDVYAWFKDILSWPLKELLEKTKEVDKDTAKKLSAEVQDKIIPEIERQCEFIKPEESGLIALDWLNGRRTPYADQKLKGAIAGLSLGSTAPKVYRALAEATAFGSKAIIDRFRQDGLIIEEITAIGGVAKKSSLVMQILADVLNMPVKVADSDQAVALGAAIFGSVAAGYYKSVEEAQKNMASGFSTVYDPIPENVKIYEKLYNLYIELGSKLEDFLRHI